MLVARYILEVFQPQLKRCGLSALQEDLICNDVRQRLCSLLANWSDERFRKTALLPALEIAQFYEPAKSPLEIRTLVVAGVRNSLLEEINTDHPFHPAFMGAGNRLPDELVHRITGAAIDFFSDNWNEKGEIRAVSGEDLFQKLAATYPLAWRRLQALATTKAADIHLTPEEVEPTAFEKAEEIPINQTVVESGFAPTLDPVLRQMLAGVKSNGEAFFFTPVFKMLTRNLEKLLRIISLLISWNRCYVTCNYLIGLDYCAKRKNLVAPPHDTNEIRRISSKTLGLLPRHSALIRKVKA